LGSPQDPFPRPLLPYFEAGDGLGVALLLGGFLLLLRGGDPEAGLLLGQLLLLALLLQTDALKVVVAAADAVEPADEGEDALLAAIGDGFGEGGHEETAEGEGLELGAAVGEGALAEGDLEFLDFLDEAGERFPEGFLLFPVKVAALTPFAEVLLGDGTTIELLGEDGLHLGLDVEPGEELGAGFTVAEAAVEGFADRARETSDFAASGAGCGGRLGWWSLGDEGVDEEVRGDSETVCRCVHSPWRFVMRAVESRQKVEG
jgi:hypothetical protein